MDGEVFWGERFNMSIQQKLREILKEANENQFYFPDWMQKKFEELTKLRDER